MFLRQIVELEKIISNMKKRGKSQEQIKKSISHYLTENKKKINPNGELDIV